MQNCRSDRNHVLSNATPGPGKEKQRWQQARLKTDGTDPVPSTTVYRFILTVFVFPGKYGNGTGNRTGCTGIGIKNGMRVFPSIFTDSSGHN
jgi:hypothetical protein